MSYKKYNDRLSEIKNLIRKRERELRLAVQDQNETPEWKQIRIRLARLHLIHARELLQNHLDLMMINHN